MRLFAFFLVLVIARSVVAQSPLIADWTVASFIEPCTEQYQYRNIYPGPVYIGESDTITWLYRDRSTCHSPYNNFNILKMRKDGTPLLAFFRKYTTPGDYYTEQIAVYGNRAYWAGTSYLVDTGRSIFLAAIDLTSGDTLWMRRWKPAGMTSYMIASINASEHGIFLTANATVSAAEPLTFGYGMFMGAWDSTGTEQWTNVFAQPFSQSFRGNIVATDSLVYTCGSRYSDVIPYYRGMGFVGAYDIHTGVLVDSFYFSKKRPLSEYVPSMLALYKDQVIAVGTNTSFADAATFVSSLSVHLDSLSFYIQTPQAYTYLSAAAVDENGLLYIASYQYASTGYHTTLDMANCKNGCYPTHRSILLQPEPVSISYITPNKGSLYLSMTANSPDTTLDVYNRADGYVAKYNVEALDVGRPQGTGRIEGVEVYPNPVTTFATARFETEVHDATFEFHDALGRCVLRYEHLDGTDFMIECNNLLPGLYFYSAREQERTIGSGKLLVR